MHFNTLGYLPNATKEPDDGRGVLPDVLSGSKVPQTTGAFWNLKKTLSGEVVEHTLKQDMVDGLDVSLTTATTRPVCLRNAVSVLSEGFHVTSKRPRDYSNMGP